MKKKLSFVCALVLLISCVAGIALADYPSSPITIICPFGAGGGNDTVARVVSAYAEKYFGVSMVVDNQSGGNTMPGSAVVAQADPDGYTILINNNVNITAATHVYEATFGVEDLIPVATPGNSSNVLVGGPSSPAKTFDEFVAYCKDHPGEVLVSCGGYLNGDGLAVFKMMEALGIEVTVIPYSSGSEQIAAVMGGHVNYACIGGSNIISYLKDETSDMFALCDVALYENSPYGIPTIAELGYPEAVVSTARTFYVPAGTPDEVIEKLDACFAELFKDPEVQEKFEAIGEPCTSAIVDSKALMEEQLANYESFGIMIEEMDLASQI